MRKRIIAAGILSQLLWLGVFFVSKGLPERITSLILRVTPYFLHSELIKVKNGFYYAVPNSQMPAAAFFVLFALAFLVYFAVITFVIKDSKGANFFPLIIFFAILFRITLLSSEPVHENDFYRYIWDGKVMLSGVNPYKYSPQEAESFLAEHDDSNQADEVLKLEDLRSQNLTFFERIGHRQVPTIYPPLGQFIFVASQAFKWNSLLFMKFLFVLFDILTIVIIYKLLILFKMNPNLSMIYAWSPLVLKEFANSGHYDSAAIFFLLAAAYFLFSRKSFVSVLMLSLGILAKFFPLVALPLFFKRIKSKKFSLMFILIGLVYAFFIFWQNTGILRVFQGLVTYSRQWAINGGIFEFLYSLTQVIPFKLNLSWEIILKGLLVFAYLGVIFHISRKKVFIDLHFFYRLFWLIAWLFLLSPVGDAWYFCWVIPFLCFFPFKSFILLSGLLIFSYLSFSFDIEPLSLGPFRISKLILIQYLPFFLILIWEVVFKKNRKYLYVQP